MLKNISLTPDKHILNHIHNSYSHLENLLLNNSSCYRKSICCESYIFVWQVLEGLWGGGASIKVSKQLNNSVWSEHCVVVLVEVSIGLFYFKVGNQNHHCHMKHSKL